MTYVSLSVCISLTSGARITAVASTDGVYYSDDFGKTFSKGTLPSGVSYKSLAGDTVVVGKSFCYRRLHFPFLLLFIIQQATVTAASVWPLLSTVAVFFTQPTKFIL